MLESKDKEIAQLLDDNTTYKPTKKEIGKVREDAPRLRAKNKISIMGYGTSEDASRSIVFLEKENQRKDEKNEQLRAKIKMLTEQTNVPQDEQDKIGALEKTVADLTGELQDAHAIPCRATV